MNDLVFKAILAMDSYNRGYNAGIEDLGGVSSNLGNAIIIRQSDTRVGFADRNAGFYAIAYKLESGETVISYRGTDSLAGSAAAGGSDTVNGYGVATGKLDGKQALLAFQFYNSIARDLNDGVPGDPRTANISVTGHSLGGGLAGLVGAVYGKQGFLFDNMTFEQAAINMKTTSIAALKSEVYQGRTPWSETISSLPSSLLKTYFVDGEFLGFLRNGGMNPENAQKTPQLALDAGTDVTISDLNGGNDFLHLHSIATLTMVLYADTAGIPGDWGAAAKYFWPVAYDDDFASSFHDFSFQQGTMFRKGDFSGILRTALAYSAIDEGARPFGDTGIVSFFDDANNLGLSLKTSGVSQTLTAYASDISKAFVEYAGLLALNKVLRSSASDPVLSGVLSYSSAVNNRTLTVDLSDAAWKAANSGVLPEMAGPDGLIDRLVNDLAVNSDPRKYPHDIRGMMGALWGDATDRAFDRAVFAISESGTTQMAGSAAAKAGILIGGTGADVLTGSQGNDLLAGGRGSDRLISGKGNDILHGGAGDDTADYSGDPNAVSVTLAPSGHIVSDGWGGTDRLADIENLILTSKDDMLTVIGAPGMKIDAGAGIDTFSGSDSVVTDSAIYSIDSMTMILNAEKINRTSAGFTTVLALGHTYSGQIYLDYSQYAKPLTFNFAKNGISRDCNVHDGQKSDLLKLPVTKCEIIGTDRGDTFNLVGDVRIYTGKGNDLITSQLSPNQASGEIVYSGGNDIYKLVTRFDIRMDHTIKASDISFQKSPSDFTINIAGHGSIVMKDINDNYLAVAPKIYLWNNQYFEVSDPTHTLKGIPNDDRAPAPYSTNGDDIVTLAPSLPYSVASTGYGNDTVYGSSGSDNIISGFGDDLMYGYAGKDYFTAGWGNDRIFGGDGDDVIFAGGGDDFIDGGAGSDTIDGGPGYDVLSYQSFTSGITIDLAAGTVTDSAGRMDFLYSIEKIIGTDFGDTSKGGAGSDQFSVSPGMDAISDAGGNADVLLMASGVGIENLSFGTSGDDLKIIRTAGVYETIIKGQLGPDSSRIIETLQFDDGFSLNLSAFKSWRLGTSSADTMNGSSAADIILGRAGNDVINGNNGNDTLAGDAGADTIHGNIGADTLYGGSGNDKLYGDSGNDVLFGGTGSDRLIGGAGADVLTGGSGADRFVFDGSAASIDTIADFNRAEDILDLSYLLPGYDPAIHAITDYVQIVTSGTNSLVKVDLDGAGTVYAWTQVATLTGVTGLTDEAALMASGHLAA